MVRASPTVPDAPGRLVTSVPVARSRSARVFTTARAVTSKPEPGPCGTSTCRSVTGPAGLHACPGETAHPVRIAAARARTHAPAATRLDVLTFDLLRSRPTDSATTPSSA